jgi:hypothetical protein
VIEYRFAIPAQSGASSAAELRSGMRLLVPSPRSDALHVCPAISSVTISGMRSGEAVPVSAWISGSSTLPTSTLSTNASAPLADRCRCPVRALGERGHHNHLCLWPSELDAFRRFEAVHPRHHDVRDHDLRRSCAARSTASLPLTASNRVIPGAMRSDLDHHRPDIVVVLDYQHLHGHGASLLDHVIRPPRAVAISSLHTGHVRRTSWTTRAVVPDPALRELLG